MTNCFQPLNAAMASACTKISACVLIRLPVALPLHEPLHKHYGCVFPATVFLSASDFYDIQICQGVEKYHYVLCKYLSILRKFFMSMVKSKHTHKKVKIKVHLPHVNYSMNAMWLPIDFCFNSILAQSRFHSFCEDINTIKRCRNIEGELFVIFGVLCEHFSQARIHSIIHPSSLFLTALHCSVCRLRSLHIRLDGSKWWIYALDIAEKVWIWWRNIRCQN